MFTALNLELNRLRQMHSLVLEGIYDKIVEIVRKSGGFVDMQNPELDAAYTVVYTDGNEALETRITALKLEKNGSLLYRTEYFDESPEIEVKWESLRHGEHEVGKALLSIAENIWQYIDFNDDRKEV